MSAPDELHKADVSGADGPKLDIPPAWPEGSVQIGLRDVSFRDHLDDCFRGGGFRLHRQLELPPGARLDVVDRIAAAMLLV